MKDVKDLLNIYEQAKNIEVVDINNQEEYDSRIHFTDLEVVNQGTTTNDEFTLSVENFEVKVEDTLLFVEGQEYQVVFGLLTIDNNVIPFINEEDNKFVYKKGEDFILSLDKNIEEKYVEEVKMKEMMNKEMKKRIFLTVLKFPSRGRGFKMLYIT